MGLLAAQIVTALAILLSDNLEVNSTHNINGCVDFSKENDKSVDSTWNG